MYAPVFINFLNKIMSQSIKVQIIKTVKLILISGILVGGANLVSAYHTTSYHEPTVAPPGDNAPAPLNVSNVGQIKIGGLTLNTGGAATGLVVQQGQSFFGTVANAVDAMLKGVFYGRVGADSYCDRTGLNCTTAANLSGVTQIIAGTGITISPTTGVGNVTVNSTGSGSGSDSQTVKVSSADTTAGFLNTELVAGTGITLTTTGTGNQTLTIAATGSSGSGIEYAQGYRKIEYHSAPAGTIYNTYTHGHIHAPTAITGSASAFLPLGVSSGYYDIDGNLNPHSHPSEHPVLIGSARMGIKCNDTTIPPWHMAGVWMESYGAPEDSSGPRVETVFTVANGGEFDPLLDVTTPPGSGNLPQTINITCFR